MTKLEFVRATKKHRGKLIELARKRGSADPEALVQELFVSLAAHRVFVSLPASGPELVRYLNSALYKRAAGEHRINMRRAVSAPMLDIADVAEREAHNPYPVLDQQIAVRSALDSLADREAAEALRLVHMHEYTLAEAAEIIGLSQSTLYRRMNAAAAILRETLSDFASDFARVPAVKKIAAS